MGRRKIGSWKKGGKGKREVERVKKNVEKG